MAQAHRDIHTHKHTETHTHGQDRKELHMHTKTRSSHALVYHVPAYKVYSVLKKNYDGKLIEFSLKG